jgi:hypothetical protein
MRHREVLRLISLGSGMAPLLAMPILILTFAASACAQTSAGAAASTSPAATTQPPSAESLENWRAGMARVPPPNKGCFTAAYPSIEWREVPCTAAPAVPYPPARGPRSDVAGNGTDVSAQVTGYITESIGSFDSVTGVTSETGTGTFNGPNAFTLQLNANFFASAACNGATNPSNCLGWQQFVYANVSCPHCAFMQYWLINYVNPCPQGWIKYQSDCYANSNAVNVPAQTITNLVNLSITGQAQAGGKDTLTMAVGGTLYAMTGEDSVVDLAQGWQAAEFNIVGDCCGSQANFNNGSTIVVRTSVDNGTGNAPSCAAEGFTGETNNLNFASAPTAQRKTLPAVVFTESSAGGAASPCASATPVGGAAAVTFTATPTAGEVPLAVTFEARNLTLPMTYTINFGDATTGGFSRSSCTGSNSVGAKGGIECSGSASHTYAAAGGYVATLLNASSTTVGTATITVGHTRPTRPLVSSTSAPPPSSPPVAISTSAPE